MKTPMTPPARLAAACSWFLFAGAASGSVLSVGPGKHYALPSQAAAAAHDGDTIAIDSRTYSGDVAVWRADRLTICGIGKRPVLDAQGHAAEQKAIWVIKGSETIIENIEFTGAAVADHNGAGIRQEGRGLTLRNCFFHDNEDGVLAGDSPDSEITIENCEFNHNGSGDGRSHNIYINHVRRFTLRGCYVHNAHIGHNVKSRALTDYILYNRISDDETSDSSYGIDFSNGGACWVIGNVIRRGPKSSNGTLVAFALEGARNPQQALYVVNNTFANDRHAAAFIRVAGKPTLRVLNNLFLGPGDRVVGAAGEQSHNLTAAPSDFRNPPLDFHLTRGSRAIDAGMALKAADGFDLTPRFQYVHPAGFQPRRPSGSPDVGAYEWDGGAARSSLSGGRAKGQNDGPGAHRQDRASGDGIGRRLVQGWAVCGSATV